MSLRDTINDNKGTAAVVGGALLLGMLNFSGGEDIELSDNTKAKESKSGRKPASKKFKGLGDNIPAPVDKQKRNYKKYAKTQKSKASSGGLGASRNGNFNYNSPTPSYGGGGSDYYEPSGYNPPAYTPTESVGDTGTTSSSGGAAASSCSGNNCNLTSSSNGGTTGSSGGGSTTVGDGVPFTSGSGDTGSSPPSSLSVNGTPGPGSYIDNPTITITGVNQAEIKYCLSNTAVCCAPNTLYSTPVEVTTNPGVYTAGNYCLSFQATASDSTTTPVKEFQFLVDNTVPALSAVLIPDPLPFVHHIQTNESHVQIQATSANFGSAGYYYYALALENTNPAIAYGGDCALTVDNHGPITDGMRTPAGVVETDALSATNVDIVADFYNGINFYGSNYVVAVMEREDQSGNKLFTCMTHEIILKDFDILAPTNVGYYQTPDNADGVNEFQGQIQYFGPFGGGLKGAGVAAGTNFNLEHGMVNIMN